MVDGSLQLYDTNKIQTTYHKTAKRKHLIRHHKKRHKVHDPQGKRLVQRKSMGSKKTDTRSQRTSSLPTDHPSKDHKNRHRQHIKRHVRPTDKIRVNSRRPIRDEVNRHKGNRTSQSRRRT